MNNRTVDIFTGGAASDRLDFTRGGTAVVDIHPMRPAAKICGGRNPDLANLAIIDCGSDSDTGLQMLQRLKQHYPGLPVIFVAGGK